MKKIMEIFGVKHSSDLLAVRFSPGTEQHLEILVENLSTDSQKAQSQILKKTGSPALSHDIKFIWELNEDCIVYYAHRYGHVLIVSKKDYEILKSKRD
jgi:hypothetical protein